MCKAIILGSGQDSLTAAAAVLHLGIHPIILEPTGSLLGPAHCNRCAHPCTPLQSLQLTAEIYLHQLVRTVYFLRDEICSLHVINSITGELHLFAGDFFYFPAPLHSLPTAMSHVPGYRFLPDRQFRNLLESPVLAPIHS